MNLDWLTFFICCASVLVNVVSQNWSAAVWSGIAAMFQLRILSPD